MQHKLFLTCPFCQLEGFLNEKFDGNFLFISAPGAVFDFSDINFSKRLSEFIEREQIEELYVVNDISCVFIDKVLSKKNHFFESTAESVFLHNLIDNYKEINACKNMRAKKEMIAEKNILKQIEILSAKLPTVKQIKGLITSQSENKIKALTNNTN